jgi:ribosome-binding protein aMBF1 (putative translation factor)
MGRVALLGIAQRQSRIPRAHIPAVCCRRKPLPTSIKTLGDLIRVKRCENRLSVGRVAIKMGIVAATVQAWESNESQPDEQQVRQLARLLNFNSAETEPDSAMYLV